MQRSTDTTNACSYCHRTFGSRVTWHGKPVYLRKERDHVLPRAIGGRETLPCCHLCNRNKASLVFGSLAEIQEFCMDALNRDGSAIIEAEPLREVDVRTCARGVCGREFRSAQPTARYCSKACQWSDWDDAHHRAKVCEFCKGQFIPRRKDQRYCKPHCADNAANQRNPPRREFLPFQNQTTAKRESRARKVMDILARSPVRTFDLMRVGGSGFSSRLAELRSDLIRFGWGISCVEDMNGATYELVAL